MTHAKSTKFLKTGEKMKMTGTGSSMKDYMKDTMKDTMKDSMLSTNRKTIGSSIMDKTAKTEVEPPKPERKFRIEKRTLFFQGAAFVIEEEISLDSDESSEVKTSEDEFSVDEQVVEDYNQRLKDRADEMDDEEKK